MEIKLHDMRFYARHGCLPQERTVGGEYLVSLCMDVEVDAAAILRDDLSGTVNYADVYEEVKAGMSVPSNLLEHVAHRIARCLLDRFARIQSVTLTVTKCAPPIPGIACQGISVTYTLSRYDDTL